MRILILGAGGPAGVNVCRALHAADHEVIGADDNPAHLPWAEPYCVKTVMGFGVTDHQFLGVYEVDLVHSQVERVLRQLTEDSGTPTLMPSGDVIASCQHKTTAVNLWHQAGLRNYPPVRIYDPLPDMLHIAKERFGTPFWLRAAVGAGAKAATLVDDLRTGFHWIRYWETRGEAIEWIAEEYLPGHDYCWTSVWRDGTLYASFTRERLEWLYPHLAPSGRTGTPTISVTVHDERVNDVAKRAIAAIDDRPNGIYCVDLREDKYGIPRPTEINAGRWATTSPLYYELGVNLPDLHARLAAGDDIEPLGDDVYDAGIKLMRHIDCPTRWLASVAA